MGTGRGGYARPPVQTTPFIAGVNVMQIKPRSEDGNTKADSAGEEAVTNKYKYVPAKEPAEAHPGQMRPTASIYTLAQSLFRKDVKEWKIQDLYTPGLPDGTSILLSIFMDYATTTLRPEMTISHRASLAKIIAAVAPEDLLNYMQDAKAAIKFLNWALTFEVQIPPVLEMHLCPIRAPNLIPREIRLKITEEELTTEEQERVIDAFVKCYYPKSITVVKEILPSLPDATVKDFIVQPGRLATEMKSKHKAMAFQPPKWYRLSIHPDTVIQSPPKPKLTPLKKATCNDLPFSAMELKSKISMDFTQLESLPLQTMKATIFAAITAVFEEKESRDGLIEAFSIAEAATKEEIINFLQTGAEQADTSKSEEVEITRELHRYYVRFEHTNRKRHEKWNEQNEEILRKWINAIHPVLVANNHILVLTNHPYVRNPKDRLVYMTPYSLEAKSLQEYTIVKSPSSRGGAKTKGSRFEVWIKTTCDYLEDMADAAKAGDLAKAYTNTMSDERIQVQYISRIADSIVPTIMIMGCIETADDEIIEEEIGDRLIRIGADPDTFPIFHVEQVTIGTSTESETIRTKCVMARKKDVKTIQNAFELIPTPASKVKYQVTSDYSFTQMKYPPTDQTDMELSAAIRKQNDFTKSIVKTTIYNLYNVAPYHDVPLNTKDPCTQRIEKNTAKSTIATIILDMKIQDETGTVIKSPVIRVTTNASGTKLHLTALRTEAKELILATNEIARLLDTWYDSYNFKALKDMTDARAQIKSVTTTGLQQQATQGGMMAKWGEENMEQRKLDRSRTADELATTAAKGIQITFTNEEKPTSIYRDEEEQKKQSEQGQAAQAVIHIDPISAGETDIRKEIGVLKEFAISQENKMSEMNNMVLQVVDIVQKLDKTPDETMMNTISTMIETSMQSSISSSTEASIIGKQLMEEYCTKMQRQMEVNSLALIQACKEKLTSELNSSKMEELVSRQEKAAETTRIALEDLKTHQTEIMKKMDEHRTYLADLLQQQERKEEDNREEEVIFDQQGEEVEETTGKKYTKEARKKAHEILTLMDKMPFRKVNDLEANPNVEEAPNEEAAFHKSVSIDICKVCRKKDLGLMYCDTCEELSGLYHAACLTLTDKATRSCKECIEKLASLSTTGKEDETEGLDHGTAESKGEEAMAEAEANEHVDGGNKAASPLSSSSSSSSSSASSSESDAKPYTPRLRRALGETSLPALKNPTKINHKSKTEETSLKQIISPVQTRAQRTAKTTQKKREDAFDTSEEEESE